MAAGSCVPEAVCVATAEGAAHVVGVVAARVLAAAGKGFAQKVPPAM